MASAPLLPRELVAGGIFRAKLAVAAAAVLVSAAELWFAWGQYPLVSVFTIAMALQSAAAGIAVHLHYWEQLASCVASTPLLLYWLASGTIALVRLRTAVATGLADIHPISVAAIAGYALIALVAIVLECQRKPNELYDSLDDDEDDMDSKNSFRTAEERANIFSSLTFAWLEPMIAAGYKKPLQMDDIGELKRRYFLENATVKFRRSWKASSRSGRASLVRTIAWTFKRELSMGIACQIVSDLLPFLQPILISRLIGFAATYNTALAEPIENGYFYAVAMFVVSTVTKVANQQQDAVSQDLEVLLETNLVSSIYRKALVLSNDMRKEHDIGTIVSHVSVDAWRVTMFVSNWLYHTIMVPVRLFLAVYMLYRTLGWSVMVGVLAMVLSTPVSASVIRQMGAINRQLMAHVDSRMRVMNDVLSGIRIIKLYAWESPFIQRINDVRIGKELAIIRKFGSLNALFSFVTSLLPFVVTFATYSVYSIWGNEPHGPLNSQLVFVSLALFTMLRYPLHLANNIVSEFVDAKESLRRIHAFLAADEIDFAAIGRRPYDRDSPAASTSDVLVSVDGGTFKWLSTGEPVLKDVDIKCRRDELVAVIGRVGAGKSSLVSAILGDMIKCSGTVEVCGSIAYVPQQPWIMNATLRDNILFGHRFDQAFYDRVVDACALRQDLDMLPAGDMTEIGEKGINLSGGQKARVSLARAVYVRADVYLLDDPLAAVDAHVGKHIFANVLGPHGLLKTRARILATNAMQYLSSADNIVMLAGGAVVDYGSFTDCMARQGEVHEFVHRFVDQSRASGPGSSTTSDTELSELTVSGRAMRKPLRPSLGQADTEDAGGALSRRRRHTSRVGLADQRADAGRTTTDEVSQEGKVHWEVYRAFIQACGVGNLAMFVVSLVVAMVTGVSGNLWLKHWASTNGEIAGPEVYAWQPKHSVIYYLLVYGALGLLGALMVSLQSLVLWTQCSITASTEIHQNMLVRMMHSPMSFFDTTPVGRILNRFNSDIRSCDLSLPGSISGVLVMMSAVITSVLVLAFATPAIGLVLPPLALAYYYVQQRYLACSRELKRMLSTTRSPIVAHFQETLGGVATVRAYGHQARFTQENEGHLEANVRVYWMHCTLRRWLSLRLETMGNIMMLSTTMLAVAAVHRTGYGDAGLIGLVVTYSMRLSGMLSSAVKSYASLENSMTHMERCIEYANLPQEAPEVIDDRRPDAQWPAQGALEFRDYSMRYREGLDLVLKGLSFSVQPGQKVGIVGRTGAGKSSLTLALFRIIEAAGGQILLDGKDLAEYGLLDVRSRLSIIPQDPVLFAGTVRENLDPFGQYSDQDIWRALENAHLADFIRGKDERLEFEVAQGGENFSVGQRQLVCLARALLKRTKVLVLDEATAAIDNATDAIIQQTIREEFKHCTVLTIAHRLNTVLDSDMILVMDGGRIGEYDTPQNLLQNENGLFAKLVEEARTSDAL
ncbi:hypothetical protein IWQ57_000607 [Coemansia nantahalensis]|uniref:Uncharacterized protein n=1 Tax=Coemansia nantahalensis TaxID=2789366 RepID=A0ACC1K7L5_9FUNG|nr:hypothetical protein IWQ57_000607 [Coemansia nantahalensis]